MRRSIGWLALFSLGAASAPLAAEVRVTAEVSSTRVYIGDQITLQVRVDDASPSAQPELPPMEDFRVTSLGRSAASSQFQIIINGRQVRQESYVLFTYQLRPLRSGTLTIPPIQVTEAGQTYSGPPISIEVVEPQQQDYVFLELSTPKREYWIEEPFTLELRVWLRRPDVAGRPLRAEPILERDPPELSIPWLTELPGCQTGDLNEFARRYDASAGGVGFSINGLSMETGFFGGRTPAVFRFYKEPKQRVGQDGATRDYYAYTMSQRYLPTVPGTLRIDPVRFKGDVPTDVSPDGYVRRSETVVVLSNPLHVVIKEPPTEGQPASYTGAIGALSMEVTAKPTEVQAGDPITLSIRITGDARLENVGPPPLAENPALTGDFKVPDDPVGGVVQGRTKTFTQSIRPRSEAVSRIPPIELSYFDTRAGGYVTLASEPIPINVTAGNRLPLEAVVASQTPAAANLTVSARGILANYTDMDEVLVSRQATVGWGWYGPAAVSPLAYVVLTLWQRRRLRVRGDVALARRLRASKLARRTLERARSQSDPLRGGSIGAEQARTVADGLLNYLADRFNLPAGGLTREEALARLEQGQVNGELRTALSEVLSDCELAAFAGSATATDELIDRARRCLEELEKARWR